MSKDNKETDNNDNKTRDNKKQTERVSGPSDSFARNNIVFSSENPTSSKDRPKKSSEIQNTGMDVRENKSPFVHILQLSEENVSQINQVQLASRVASPEFHINLGCEDMPKVHY